MPRFLSKTGRQLTWLGIAMVLGLYVAAWRTPAIGLAQSDAVNLITARALVAGHGYTIDSLPTPIPQTATPPLFPAILAIFTLISSSALWLKLLPLLCTAAAGYLYWRLLGRMGASGEGAALVVLLAASVPNAVFQGTNLFPEPLFAVLVAATLLALLDDHAGLAGLCAGLATLTMTAGLALIMACALTFLLRGRVRRAVTFTAFSMALAAPWFGWSIAHGRDLPHVPSNILTSLPLNEKGIVLGANVVRLFASIWQLMTGLDGPWPAGLTAALLIWCLWKRRQTMPDLFLVLYAAATLCILGQPSNFLIPVFPLVLWLFWRVVREIRPREAVAAALILLGLAITYTDFTRFRYLGRGSLPVSSAKATPWRDIARLSDWVKQNTPPDSVLAANLAPALYLQTGRKATRGFDVDPYRVGYQPGGRAVTPDVLTASILRESVGWVAITPDRDQPEAAAWHRSAEALVRGGLLEPVPTPELGEGIHVFRVVSAIR